MKGGDAMIEMQEEEHAQSVFSDDELRDILMVCGPKVKDSLLITAEVHHDKSRTPAAKLG